MAAKIDVNFERRFFKKPCFSFGKTMFFQKSPFEVNIDFPCHFGANLAPFWHQKSMKIHPKTDLKRHQKIDQFWDRFFIDFGRVLGSNLDPCWPPRRPKTPPKPLQDASKTTQVRPPRRLQDEGGVPHGPVSNFEVSSIKRSPPRAPTGPWGTHLKINIFCPQSINR